MTQQIPPPPPWPEWPFDCAVTGLVDVDDEPIDFTPVPRQRKRRNGWTELAQRAFIAALEECGCVRRSARAVGMSARSAYNLLGAEGADSFAAAWDQAIARGVERVRGEAMLRALHGSWVPVVRKGRVVRMEFRHNDKLAIGILSGRGGSVAERREQAVSRRKYRLRLQERARREEAEQRRRDAIWAEHQAIIDKPPPRPGPAHPQPLTSHEMTPDIVNLVKLSLNARAQRSCVEESMKAGRRVAKRARSTSRIHSVTGPRVL